MAFKVSSFLFLIGRAASAVFEVFNLFKITHQLYPLQHHTGTQLSSSLFANMAIPCTEVAIFPLAPGIDAMNPTSFGGKTLVRSTKTTASQEGFLRMMYAVYQEDPSMMVQIVGKCLFIHPSLGVVFLTECFASIQTGKMPPRISSSRRRLTSPTS
jgi:hypothetical protein